MERDPLAPEVDPADPPTSTPRRRRRARMGQVVERLGRKAGADVTAGSVLGDVARREQAAKAKALLEGGRNKGEMKGYGAARRPRP